MKHKTSVVSLPEHSASPTKPFASRYCSSAPSLTYKAQPQAPQPHAANDDTFRDSSCIPRPLPATRKRHAKAFATLEGALTLTETELLALRPVPRLEAVDARDADVKQERGQEWERRWERRGLPRPPRRSRAPLPRKVEFALRVPRKAYLRKYGVPMYALLCAPEDALSKIVVGGSAPWTKVSLRAIEIQFMWPRSPVSASSVVYEEWVPIDESATKVQLGMLVAKAFHGFLTQKATAVSQEPAFEWRVRPDALYRTWLTRLDRVQANVYVANLRYALNDL